MLLELIAILNLLVVAATSLYVVKTMKNAETIAGNVVFSVKDELFEWFKSEEGLIFVGDLGKLFAAGAMTQLKVPQQQGSVKLFGYKVPHQIISAILGKVMGNV